MAAKKSSIALMLSAAMMLATVSGCGMADHRSDKTAYSKEMSYQTDWNVLSEESRILLDRLAEQTKQQAENMHPMMIGNAKETTSHVYLTFAEVQAMIEDTAAQLDMASDDDKNDYVGTGSSSKEEAEEKAEKEPAEEAGEEIGENESTEQKTEEEKSPLDAYAENRVVTNDAVITSTLNVRSGPGTEYEVVGRFYPHSTGIAAEEKDGWIRIQSGNIEGWVSSEYLITGEAVAESVMVSGACVGTVTAEALNVRNQPSMDSVVINSIAGGKTCTITGFLEDGWLQIRFGETAEGYVSAEYVEVSFEYLNAMTLEEEQAYLIEKARLEAEARRAAAAAESRRQAESQALIMQLEANLGSGPVALSEEEIRMIACVVNMEAMTEPYVGKLAVANVVVNRYRSGIWGDIRGVIYAPGQFTVNGTYDRLNYYQSVEPTAESWQAARDACAGMNNIGGLMYFCSAKKANPAAYRAYVWVGTQCFYQK